MKWLAVLMAIMASCARGPQMPPMPDHEPSCHEDMAAPQEKDL